MGKQVEVLEHHAHFLPHGVKLTVRHMCQVLALEQDLSAAGLFQAVQTPEKGTLTGTGRSDNDHFFALFNVGGNVFQNVEIAERLVQMFNLDHCVPASFPDVLPENSES